MRHAGPPASSAWRTISVSRTWPLERRRLASVLAWRPFGAAKGACVRRVPGRGGRAKRAGPKVRLVSVAAWRPGCNFDSSAAVVQGVSQMSLPKQAPRCTAFMHWYRVPESPSAGSGPAQPNAVQPSARRDASGGRPDCGSRSHRHDGGSGSDRRSSRLYPPGGANAGAPTPAVRHGGWVPPRGPAR